MVPLSLAQALGVCDNANIPVVDRMKQHLRDKVMLLVLDNFEQVMPAATLLGELLQQAHGLKILVSSREILHIYGEHDFPVEPLSLPDGDLASPYLTDWMGYAVEVRLPSRHPGAV